MNAAFGGARQTDLNRKAEHVATACPSRVSDGGLSHAEGGTRRQCGSLAAAPSDARVLLNLRAMKISSSRMAENHSGFLLLLKCEGGGQREFLHRQRGQIYL